MQPLVLERHDDLVGERRRCFHLLGVERVRREDELAEVGGARAQWKGDSLPAGVGIAGTCDHSLRAEHHAARAARRLDGRFDDDANEMPRVMCRSQRGAEPCRRSAHPLALGLELGVPLLELRGHAVERHAELRELVAPAHLDALAEPSVRDRVGGVRESPQRADDRPAEQVRDDAEDDQRRQQRCEEAFLGRTARGIDRALTHEHREHELVRARQRCGPQTAIRRRRRLAGWRGVPARERAGAAAGARDDPAGACSDSACDGESPTASSRTSCASTGTRHGDRAEHASVIDNRDCTGRTDAEPELRPGIRGGEPGERTTVMTPQRALQLRIGRELPRLARRRGEPRPVRGDHAAQPRIDGGVDPARLATTRQRVVAVERDGER